MGNTNSIQRICVFCGSSSGVRSTYAHIAQKLGRAIASRGLGLVYGGGNVGLMGLIANAVIKESGEVVGVIPHALSEKELAHNEVTKLHLVSGMHERKALMAELSDAFIVLPGGFGTFDEFFEIVTWAQLGFHSKPIGLLNVEGYFDLLLDFISHMLKEGFIKAKHRQLILESKHPEEMLQVIIDQHSQRVFAQSMNLQKE